MCGGKALAFFNLADKEQVLTISSEKLRKKGVIRDLWRQKNVGVLKNKFSVKLNAHGTAFFKIK